MPVVVLSASSLGKTGYESPAELMADQALSDRIEALRLKVGPMMNLGDVTNKDVPKLTLVAPPPAGGHIETPRFLPHEGQRTPDRLPRYTLAPHCAPPCSPPP